MRYQPRMQERHERGAGGVSSGRNASVMRTPNAAVLRQVRSGRARRQTRVFSKVRRCSDYARLHYRACEACLWLVGRRSTECPGLLIGRTRIRARTGQCECNRGLVGSAFPERPLRLRRSLPQSPSAKHRCLRPRSMDAQVRAFDQLGDTSRKGDLRTLRTTAEGKDRYRGTDVEALVGYPDSLQRARHDKFHEEVAGVFDYPATVRRSSLLPYSDAIWTGGDPARQYSAKS
jgi:hypothetical protein